MNRPRLRRPARAGELLGDLQRNLGVAERLQQYRIWQIWDEVVGPQTASHARPLRIRDNTLEVRVDHPVWMQQLQLLKPRLIARLNERIAPAAIADIYWRRGDLPPAMSPPPPPPPLPEPTPDQLATIDQRLATITDPELRAAFRTLLIADLRQRLGKP